MYDLHNEMMLSGWDNIVSLLIKNGSEVNHHRSGNGKSPMKAGIDWATECQRSPEKYCKSATANQVLETLIKNKADVNEKLNSEGFTLLHLATQLGEFNNQ